MLLRKGVKEMIIHRTLFDSHQLHCGDRLLVSHRDSNLSKRGVISFISENRLIVNYDLSNREEIDPLDIEFGTIEIIKIQE